MAADVEMQLDEPVKVQQEISASLSLLEKAVISLEPRFATRALRSTFAYRHSLTTEILRESIEKNVKDPILQQILMEESLKSPKITTITDLASKPELEIFVGCLVVFYLYDNKHYAQGIKASLALIEVCKRANKRTLDPLLARLYFFYAHFHDVQGNLSQVQSYLPLIRTVISAYRTATLKQDFETQATLMNIILRNYLAHNMIEQADKFVSKTAFPPSAGNNQLARYMYYIGRIKAIQLEYSASYANLLQAVRKAPQSPETLGFQQVAHKLCVIVQLLMGEIPERSLFLQQGLSKALVPYLKITQAVRIGDLAMFQEALSNYEQVFQKDGNMNLITRLRHNVIKAGIRRISVAYSRISLKDICLKLQLESEQDAEYIVAKTIRDGVIDATINHQLGYMQSNEVLDVYSTNEPMHTFGQRISFCLDLHNESVQALRFPQNAHKDELKVIAEKLEEDREITMQMLQDGLDEDEDMGDY